MISRYDIIKAVQPPKLLCPCQFLVPVNYNDGTPVSPETIVAIAVVLNRQFGGYTKMGRNEGCWEGQIEEVIPYEVCVREEEIPSLKEVVMAIGKLLGQKKMYFKQGPPSVDLMDTSE